MKLNDYKTNHLKKKKKKKYFHPIKFPVDVTQRRPRANRSYHDRKKSSLLQVLCMTLINPKPTENN